MKAGIVSRHAWRRFCGLITAGFEVMTHHPYDVTEAGRQAGVPVQPGPGTDSPGTRPEGSMRPAAGRSIKVVPPPASQRYQAARPTHIPASRSRRKRLV